VDVPATLAAPDQPELTEAQSRELERRLAAHEMSPDDVISWERVKAEAQARTRR
jgi:putative addiction module component (TIGR02574 family)